MKIARAGEEKDKQNKNNYLPDTCQSQSRLSIACFFHTLNPRRRRFSSSGVSMHASGALSPVNVFIYSEPLGEITVSCCPFFFSPGCPDGICVNNISLVRQKISTGYQSGGD